MAFYKSIHDGFQLDDGSWADIITRISAKEKYTLSSAFVQRLLPAKKPTRKMNGKLVFMPGRYKPVAYRTPDGRYPFIVPDILKLFTLSTASTTDIGGDIEGDLQQDRDFGNGEYEDM